MKYSSSVWILLLVLLCLCSTVLCVGCKKEETCKAECGGESFDITGLVKSLKPIESGDGYTFGISCAGQPCSDLKNTAVCQTKESDGREWSLGVVNSTEWALVSKNPLQVAVTYRNGDPEGSNLRSSVITITENATHSSMYTGEDTGSSIYSFSIQTSSGNIYASNGVVATGIIGWVIILLCLLGFVAYFIIGAIVMYVVKGARGLEIIPQYTIWKDFPFLLKDGVMFLISPYYKRSNYEKI